MGSHPHSPGCCVRRPFIFTRLRTSQMSMPCWLADLMMRGSSNSNIAAMATHRDPLAQFLPILFLLLSHRLMSTCPTLTRASRKQFRQFSSSPNLANNLFASSCDNQRPIIAFGTCHLRLRLASRRWRHQSPSARRLSRNSCSAFKAHTRFRIAP